MLRPLSFTLMISALPAAVAAQATPLAVGTAAPTFTLASANAQGPAGPVSLESLKGQTVVLAFFPRARTSGCTVQMDAYRDQYAKLFGENVKLLAVSTDADTTLAAWARERNYPFTFLSDPGGVVGSQYGTYNSEKDYERRTLYVIAPDGKVSYVAAPFQEVDPTSYTKLAGALEATGHHH